MRKAKRLAQLKTDARNAGWPWPIEHPHDERALTEGCYLDFAAAERVRNFYRKLLRVPRLDGGSGTQPFELLNWWYQFVLAPIFAWKRPNGLRRFDKIFCSTGKKSGKSTVLSGLPAYMITADGEEEAEAYSTAVDSDQAKIIYRKTSRMVRQSPDLSRVLKRVDSQNRIVHHASGSWYEALASDADGADGKNPHLLIMDELHRWKDRSFFNALMYGDIARRQPLFLMITTAGDDRECVGFEEYEYAKRLLSGEHYSQSHFAFIAEAPGEDLDEIWDQPESWEAANPSLAEGIGSIAKLQAKCDEAKRSPRKKREFIRFICNRWVDAAETPWIRYEAWENCGGELEDHDGDPCWGALDLSSVRDCTALCLAFVNGDEISLRWWFFVPEENLRQLEHDWKVPLRDWVKAGWVIATPGNVVDYAWIRKLISGVALDENGQPLPPEDDCLANRFQIQEIAYDRWNAQKLVTELGEYDGIAMHEQGQGFAGMSGPCKEFERRVLAELVRHGDNPVADWMIRNCVADQDPAGNLKLNKRKSGAKIDGIVTAVMAVGRAVAGDGGGSVYDGKESLAL
jgi:phage terminase large subunit-like protein